MGPMVRTEVHERIVEVPMAFCEERLVEVPQVQVAEFIKQVPVQHVQEVAKQIPKVETRTMEKVVKVPHNLIHEVAVEVPQVITQEVVTQVPSNTTAQRIVQTGVELERRMDREAALQTGNIVLGQAQYTGHYTGNMSGLGVEMGGVGVMHQGGHAGAYASGQV